MPAPAAPRPIAPVSAPRRPGIPGALPGCWFVLVALNYVTDPLHWKRMVLTLDAARLWFEAPFTVSQQLRVLPDHLAAGAAALACLAAGFLAGGGPAVWFGTGDRPLRLALGLGSASLIQLGLGLTGLLVPWIMWPAAALLALAGGRGRGRARTPAAPAVALPRLFSGWTVWPVVTLAGVSAALNVLGGLAPETGYDSLIQHLADPRAYLSAHRIAFNDLSFLAQHPAGIEMLYAAVLPAGGDQAAKLLHGALALLTCWTVLVWLRRRLPPDDALALAAMLYLTPFTGILSARAYIDHGLTFYAGATLLAPWGSVLQGVMVGLAIGAKYLGGFLLFGWVPALIAAGSVGGAVRVAAGASWTAGWWGVRNWLNTGNPVYPFAYGLFGGLAWDPHSAGQYAQELAGYGRVEGWSGHFAIPWSAVVRDHGALDDGSLGPLWLAAAALIVIPGARMLPRDRTLALAVAALWGCWLLSPRQVRYALMLLPLTLAALPPLLHRARERWLDGWRLAAVACVPLMVVQLQISFAALYLWVNPWYVVSGMITPGQYLSRIMEPRDSRTGRSLYGDLPMALASSLPVHARTYMMGDAKVYYLPGDWQVNALFNPPLLARVIRASGTPAEAAKRLRQRGISHLLYNVGGSIHIEYTHHVYRWNDREFALLCRMASTWWKPVTLLSDSNGDPMYQLYALQAGTYPDPRYLPGLDTRLAGVEMEVEGRHLPAAREAAAALLREYPSSPWLRRRTSAIINRHP